MIYKVLVGNEHGGAATSSKEIIDAFVDNDLNFKVVFLCENRFSKLFSSNNIKNLKSFEPPIIQSDNWFKKHIQRIKFLFWIILTTFLFVKFIKKNKIKNIHTTNNHALLVCLISKIIVPDIYIISHWRCVGLASSNQYFKLLEKIDKIIAISTEVKKSLPAAMQAKTSVIYDGVNVNEINVSNKLRSGELRSILGIGSDEFLIGTIGSFTSIKCHELIIDSMFELHKSNIFAVLIGSCPNKESEKYLEYLMDKVSRNNLQNNVFFLHDQEVFPPKYYISDLDLFVGATWNEGRGEGFGLIYIEAMAAQLPLVAIKVGAAKEIIKAYKTGFLIEDNNSAKLAKTLLMAFDNKTLLNEFGEKGLERAFNKFDISITLEALKRIYLSVN